MEGYSIGTIAKITGISRDRLRHYEKLGIIKPQRKEDNQYRYYTDHDIDRILALELYRGTEMNLTKISKICTDSTLEEIQIAVRQQESSVKEQIQHLRQIQYRTTQLLQICENVKKYLNQICVMDMEPFEIIGEISDYRSYQEYQKLNCTGDDEIPIVQKMQRRILFNEQGVYENKMVIIKEQSRHSLQKRKCVYTIVKDGETSDNTMEITFQKCIRYCQEHNLQPTGEVYIGMLLLYGNKGKVQSYLEIKGCI